MPNDIKELRRLMRSANYIRKNNPVILRGAEASMSRSLKYAWWFENFRKQLATGAFRFSYFKKDGSIREAVGTLDFGLIPTEHLPKGTADSETSEVSTFAYYDLEKGSWRSFCLDNFIGFVEEVK